MKRKERDLDIGIDLQAADGGSATEQAKLHKDERLRLLESTQMKKHCSRGAVNAVQKANRLAVLYGSVCLSKNAKYEGEAEGTEG